MVAPPLSRSLSAERSVGVEAHGVRTFEDGQTIVLGLAKQRFRYPDPT